MRRSPRENNGKRDVDKEPIFLFMLCDEGVSVKCIVITIHLHMRLMLWFIPVHPCTDGCYSSSSPFDANTFLIPLSEADSTFPTFVMQMRGIFNLSQPVLLFHTSREIALQLLDVVGFFFFSVDWLGVFLAARAPESRKTEQRQRAAAAEPAVKSQRG